MGCSNPVPGYRLESGDVVMVERGSVASTIFLPCGRCIGCRLERARQWQMRIMHEAKMWQDNCFITLTYDDAHLPEAGSLVYGDYQRFMRRLRKEFVQPIRFFVVGEYGEETLRPHYHAALFNCGFVADRVPHRKRESGFTSYRSATLERLWPHGLSELGELTPESAAYVARYVLKKVYGDQADEHYKSVCRETGEVVWRVPEFSRMSLRPGVGATWFAKWHADVFPHDRVVVKGKSVSPPRYYTQLAERMGVVDISQVRADRELRAYERRADNTPERLLVKEQVQSARLGFYRRKLK